MYFIYFKYIVHVTKFLHFASCMFIFYTSILCGNAVRIYNTPAYKNNK